MQWYGNELSRVSDMAQSAYGQIQMIMQFTQMDYETAKDSYQTEFNNRMSVYKAVADQFNADRAFASTQWSMMASYISKGQTTWDKFTPEQKAQIAKYEVQMGMPIGFMSTLQMEAGANVISTQRIAPNGGTYTDIIYKDTDGATKVKSVYTGQTRIASSILQDSKYRISCKSISGKLLSFTIKNRFQSANSLKKDRKALLMLPPKPFNVCRYE